ncbi:hypothetical protein ACFL3D_01520 [Candidatus Omnitrophota bacterium]
MKKEMKILYAEIETSLLKVREKHKVYDNFFNAYLKIKDKDCPIGLLKEEERNSRFSKLCLTVTDPEFYPQLFREAKYSLKRLITKLDFIDFFGYLKWFIRKHKLLKATIEIRCKWVWNLYQDAKQNGIVEPLSVTYLKEAGETKYKYDVGGGNSRIWVAKKLRIERLKCIVFDIDDTNEVKGKEIAMQDIQHYFKYPIRISDVPQKGKPHLFIVSSTPYHVGYALSGKNIDKGKSWAEGNIE